MARAIPKQLRNGEVSPPILGTPRPCPCYPVTSARYSSSTCFMIAMSEAKVSGSNGPNENRKKDAYGDT